MEAEKLYIIDFNVQHTNAEEVGNLIKDVYSTSDSMSETFEEKFASAVDVNEYFKQIVALPGGVVLFAVIESTLVGYISVSPRGQSKLRHTADLNMGVKSGFRGKHIGTELLKAAIDKIIDEKTVEIVYLMVRSDNHGALKLYENSGFEKIASLERDTKISEKYYDGILMRRFL